MPRRVVLIGLAVVVCAFGVKMLSSGGGDYSVKLVVPSAAQLLKGSPVWIDGLRAGSVKDLSVEGGKAVIEVGLSDKYAPLHAGTTSRVEWNSVVGERVLTLIPGPAKNSKISDDATFEAESKQIEIDQVLSALDKPTRTKLVSLIGQLDETASGSESDMQATIRSAGPAADALGQVLQAVGRDGPAIHDLITQLTKMTAVAADHQSDISGTVSHLTELSASIAEQQSQLSGTLKALPGTLSAADSTLKRVPEAGAVTTPLLRDLEPATKRLTGVAKNLTPVMQDLRPAAANLRPLLDSAQQLLGTTPALLGMAHQVLPPVQNAVEAYQPALAYLRPYTPELVGWIQNFGESFAGYDSQGHFWAATLAPGLNSFDDSIVQPPTSFTSPRPKPGEIVGQSWTDAQGSELK
jgi:phospholipid/cholesterol/gamma-HCH transport system substrate-binding protein